MHFGNWRGMPLAFAVATTLGLGLVHSARADGFLPPHVLPGWVPAYDYTTGQQYQAPPIPYGHYAKNYLTDGALGRHLGCLSCSIHGLMGGGLGCLHHGDGDGSGHGCLGHFCLRGHKHGDGCGPDGCGSGHSWFGHHQGPACVVPGCGGGHGCLHGAAGTAVVGCDSHAPSAQAVVQPTGQSACGIAGCHIGKHHSHGHGLGLGHGLCGLCGSSDCDGSHKHGNGTGCGLCGGKGCAQCLARLSACLHGRLASLTGLLHRPRVNYFVGAGGPVSLTPGYVPYIVATRSPRDYFAFPPRNPNDP
jgi:hypothetical protein